MIRNRLAAYEGCSGFILDWMVTGFFPNGTVGGEAPNLYEPKRSRSWKTDRLGRWGGETAIRGIPPVKAAAAIEWLPLRAPADWPKLDLREHLRAYPELKAAWPEPWDHQWYALAVIEADTAQPAELRLAGHDGCRLWFNGQLVFEEHSWHKLAYDLHTVGVKLARGPNTILMKLDRFGLVARLTAPGGRRLKGKAVALTTAEPKPEPPGTLEQLIRHARTLKVTMPCPDGSATDVRRWQRAARTHYRKCFGPFPKVGPDKAECVEQMPRDGYTRFRYQLTREAGSILPVYILVPDAGRFNGRTVICPHGHGQDDKVVAGIDPPETPRGNWLGPYTGNYAEILARAGFLTATWSERALSHERWDLWGERSGDRCNLTSLMAQAMGMTLPGLHLFDLHGVTDFVCGLPGADPRRVGLTGLSGGGTMTMLAGAYDDRFKAVAPFCGVFDYADYAKGIGGCGQQIVPGLYPTLDVGEILGLIAPRPLLLGQGRMDTTFSVPLLRRAARQARRAYKALGAAAHLRVHVYDLAHQVDTDAAIAFFNENL